LFGLCGLNLNKSASRKEMTQTIKEEKSAVLQKASGFRFFVAIIIAVFYGEDDDDDLCFTFSRICGTFNFVAEIFASSPLWHVFIFFEFPASRLDSL
jgi:hypothetical protein